MLKQISTILAVASLSIPFGIVAGCEETVSKKETTETKSDGTVVREEKKTTESPDGSRKTTTEKEVDKSGSTDR